MRSIASKETDYKKFNLHWTRQIITKETGQKESIYTELGKNKKSPVQKGLLHWPHPQSTEMLYPNEAIYTECAQ